MAAEQLTCAWEREKLVRKIFAGDIPLPLVRIEASERCAKHVPLADVAKWIDDRMEEVRRECQAMHGLQNERSAR
ncbi:pyocin activator PrtN family protein [Methylobacterium symbioticum]|uniref:pyocin activator PrtN family protein n=1 Tax=Methylobacterium symbioticum TaxID=2584084 RepID=UPI00115AAF8D|nr:pyocin activator PrtN family protein [Methylobacterium symbioticum]